MSGMPQRTLLDGIDAAAEFDPTGLYRYTLRRVWAPAQPLTCFLMLNPSTADAMRNDPTVTRCIGFAHRWNAGGLLVGNIFGLRSTDPRALYDAADPIGPDNDRRLVELARAANRVVVAWGVHGVLRGRGAEVARMMASAGIQLVCLGRTKDGHPRHPLYLPAAAEPQPYQ